jgi:hypothetical protein
MATQTPNYKLIKQGQEEYYDVDILNGNMDMVDMALKEHDDVIEEVSSQLAATTKIEKAGGTATAITLTSVSLTDGSLKTFIITANNNAAATTINGKSLYKPGTTTAPKLTAGKAVTVWYDTTGNCFFLKASGGGGGTALAPDVVAPKTIITEDGDEVVGTLVDRPQDQVALDYFVDTANAPGYIYAKFPKGAYRTGHWANNQDYFSMAFYDQDFDPANFLATKNMFGKQGAIPVLGSEEYPGWVSAQVENYVVDGRLHVSIPSGAYLTKEINGRMGVFVDDANYVTSNIRKGVKVLNLTGTLDTEIYNFPLSIQDTAPTALAVGHIWVKSSTLESKVVFTPIYEAVNAGAPNGTLMFVTGSMSAQYNSIAQVKKTTGGKGTNFSVNNPGNPLADWIVSTNSGTMKFPKPMVYSKIDGVVDIETAYMWSGSSWVLLSQKGNYLFSLSGFSNYSGGGYYNYLYNGPAGFRLNTTVPVAGTGSATTNAYMNHCMKRSYSSDGTYVVLSDVVYKRTGDVFAQYFTIPPTITISGATNIIRQPFIVLSRNGQRLMVTYVYVYGGATYTAIAVYVNNGSTFVLSTIITGIGYIAGQSSGMNNTDLMTNLDGSFFAIGAVNGSNSLQLWYGFLKSDGTYTVTNSGIQLYSNNTYYGQLIDMTPDNKYLIFGIAETYGSTNRYLYSMFIDYTNKVLTSGTYLTTALSAASDISILGIHPTNTIFYRYNNVVYIVYVGGGSTMLATQVPSILGAVYFSADGTNALGINVMRNSTTTITIYSVSFNHANTIFTSIGVITTTEQFRNGGAWIPAP